MTRGATRPKELAEVVASRPPGSELHHRRPSPRSADAERSTPNRNQQPNPRRSKS
jgi:hypothetical protein